MKIYTIKNIKLLLTNTQPMFRAIYIILFIFLLASCWNDIEGTSKDVQGQNLNNENISKEKDTVNPVEWTWATKIKPLDKFNEENNWILEKRIQVKEEINKMKELEKQWKFIDKKKLEYLQQELAEQDVKRHMELEEQYLERLRQR